MKKLFSIALLSTLYTLSYAQTTYNPAMVGAYTAIGALATNSDSQNNINTPPGVKIYNPQSIQQDISISNGIATNGNVVNGPDTPIPNVPQENTSNTPNTPEGVSVIQSKNPDGSLNEQELEEMMKRNEKILEDLNKRGMALQNLNGQQSKQIQQQNNSSNQRSGQIKNIAIKNIVQDISNWNKSSIEEYEKKGKENAEAQYELFLQNR